VKNLDSNRNYKKINEDELMDYYGYSGFFGRLQIRVKYARSWIHHYIAYSSLFPGITIIMQRRRGVKIGNGCHISPYVLIDLMYPDMVTIEDNVGIGSNSMIFAHVNPTSNLNYKQSQYPRKIDAVLIKEGAWINPGCIITPGTTIGKNSILSVGTVVSGSIPDNCVVAGNPGRIIKKIE
jgi:acetyltransferase-like isoleucine patch superfamily enzyme